MKNIILLFTIALGLAFATSCIEEIDPKTSYVTEGQLKDTPGIYEKSVNTITSSIIGRPMYGSVDDAYDFGYPSVWIQHDIMGQDMAYNYDNWWSSWYCARYLGPTYARCQIPWTTYYKWIDNCNKVLQMAGDKPTDNQKSGVGIAYAMRAMFYMDLARMFAQKTYGLDKTSETVPIVTEKTALADLSNNPRATNEVMWKFILEDLDKAETYLEGYQRPDVYTPNKSVVYAFKARAYQVMEDWPNAEKYAKLAMAGFTALTEAQYTDRMTAFNTPDGQNSWIFGLTYKPTDPCILENDADTSFGSHMCLELDPDNSGMGYASNYGQQITIDRHLYESIPATDFRKKCFVDFAIDDLPSKSDKLSALEAYSDHPDWIYHTGYDGYGKMVGGLSLKFRLAGGAEGRVNHYKGVCMALPIVRVEEMQLIEAEAVGMQAGREAEGIALLTAFAQSRDASYTYGTHNEAYYNASTPKFQNEVWWQRRVEFWGEGLATYDIKRLSKGIIRSYPNTNHLDGYQWNSETTPIWMNLCIVQTETNFNRACTNNPAPVKAMGNDPQVTTF